MDAPSKPGARRRPLDAALNLVPYIDLLTCLVAFLLATAVWTQLAGLAVAQKSPGARGSEMPPPVPTKLLVLVDPAGFNLVVGEEARPIARSAGRYDFAGLGAALARVKQALPDRLDLQLASDDAVDFDTLVRTMDAALAAGFPQIAVIEAAAAQL
jgi:biopolymer transport protein ExbD